jgi:hypothetical protein
MNFSSRASAKFHSVIDFIKHQRTKISAVFEQIREKDPIIADGVVAADTLRSIRNELASRLHDNADAQRFLHFYDRQSSRRALSVL